ncbi:carbohydrate porin [Aliagarivorans taiwanensis]|uniref:carbohydrate porin n=1 Tax=Aliagarivorans taiwanensis TaxID=561966 RepID=UPI0004173FE6|nr:carbohydrate porin [Aliagarivorans taiwanensis]
MKKNLLANSILVALAFSAGSAAAMSTDFSMHGYVKSGVLMTKDGTRGKALAPLTYGKWRLGNEQNTKIELLPTITMTTDDGVIARVRANITHETDCTADWNCMGENGTQWREGYVELENLSFAPGSVFWAGRRYSSSNASNHQYDWEYIQYNGTGGGVDKVDLGFARLDVGLYAFSPDNAGDEAWVPEDGTKIGYSEDYSLNVWLKDIAGAGLDLQVTAHTMEKAGWRPEQAESGLGFTGVYNFDGFYNLANGYSRAVFQYGQGLAAGDSLGKNGWGYANSKGTKSWRFVLDGMASFGAWDVSTFAFYQDDSDYAPWQNAAKGEGEDRSLWAVGVRPYHQISNNFAMQYELGYEYLDTESSDTSGGMVKATIAPTLTFSQGFWGRPQIRFFATYAKWDKEINGRLDESYSRDGNTDTLNFGVQGEVWF